jgi:hypothetical protein
MLTYITRGEPGIEDRLQADHAEGGAHPLERPSVYEKANKG